MKREISQLRRERGRWKIIRALQASRPIGAREEVVRTILSELCYSGADLRRELEWMRDAGLVQIIAEDDGAWSAKLTRDGIDIAEYSVPAPDGIRRQQVRRRHAA